MNPSCVATDVPAIHVSRALDQVGLGGHPVPEDKIVSCCHRSPALFVAMISAPTVTGSGETGCERRRFTALGVILNWQALSLSNTFVPGMSDGTRMLEAMQAGEPQAAGELLPLVYDELRQIAAANMAREQPGHTLQPTALVHEAWLRLGGDAQPAWKSRAHFFAAAAEAMRRLLVESARRKARLKRGERAVLEPLGDTAVEIAADAPTDELLAVHEALDRLAAEDQVAASVAKLRYFVGLPLPQVAQVLEVSPRTASRLWAYARVRLKEIIRGSPD